MERMRPVQYMREMNRRVSLRAIDLSVKIEGTLPKSTSDEPYFLAFFPHSDHLDSVLIPQEENITYLAGADHFKAWKPVTWGAWLIASTIPVVRRPEDVTIATQKKLYRDLDQAFAVEQKVGVYLQGSRVGPTETPELLNQSLQDKQGILKLSKRSKAQIIPVGISYDTASYQPRKGGDSSQQRLFKRLQGVPLEPAHVTVRIGEPLPPYGSSGFKGDGMELLAYTLWNMVGEPQPEDSLMLTR